MKMSDIKFPIISNYFLGDVTKQKNNPSSLYSYLGWKGARRKSTNTIPLKQSVPLLIYLDIFKNYFANTQEEKFYIIAGSTEATVTFSQKDESSFTTQVGQDANKAWKNPMGITATLKTGDSVKDYATFWKSVKIRFYNPSTGQSKESYANYLTSNSNTQTSYRDKITTIFPAGNSLEGYTTIQGIYIELLS